MNGLHLLLFVIIGGLIVKMNQLKRETLQWKESCKIYAEDVFKEHKLREFYTKLDSIPHTSAKS